MLAFQKQFPVVGLQGIGGCSDNEDVRKRAKHTRMGEGGFASERQRICARDVRRKGAGTTASGKDMKNILRLTAAQ